MFGNTIDKVRLLFCKDKESYLRFYQMLGFYPRDIRIYEQALLHKSSSIKSDKGRLLNNERLEFLGDAVLDAVVADILYQKFDGKREGFLTNTRSKIVSRETLNRVAEQIGLLQLIKFSTRQSAHNSYMGGNAFEALIGAIYLDRGYEDCRSFLEHRIIGVYINIDKIARKEVNFKSKLIEWSQKNRMELSFELLSQKYDEFNSPIFETEVIIETVRAGRGKGYSKKESQQLAAHESLDMIKKDSFFMERVCAAKALRENYKKVVVYSENETEGINIQTKKTVKEELEVLDDRESIISAAEEAAFRGME